MNRVRLARSSRLAEQPPACKSPCTVGRALEPAQMPTHAGLTRSRPRSCKHRLLDIGSESCRARLQFCDGPSKRLIGNMKHRRSPTPSPATGAVSRQPHLLGHEKPDFAFTESSSTSQLDARLVPSRLPVAGHADGATAVRTLSRCRASTTGCWLTGNSLERPSNRK